MKSHEQIEAELLALGPPRTSTGWKATIQKGTLSTQLSGWTKLSLLEDLLRYAEQRAKGKP